MDPRTVRWTAIAFVAFLALPASAVGQAPPASVELGARASAMIEAATNLTANLSADSPRDDVVVARDALYDMRAAVDANVTVGGITIFEADAVDAAIRAGLDKTFWLLLVLDVKADPASALVTATGKVESAEDKLDVDVTAKGARHARDQLRHALGLVTALRLYATHAVDAEVLADLDARIRADLFRADEALDEAEACDCPVRLRMQTTMNVVVRAAGNAVQSAARLVGALG